MSFNLNHSISCRCSQEPKSFLCARNSLYNFSCCSKQVKALPVKNCFFRLKFARTELLIVRFGLRYSRHLRTTKTSKPLLIVSTSLNCPIACEYLKKPAFTISCLNTVNFPKRPVPARRFRGHRLRNI